MKKFKTSLISESNRHIDDFINLPSLLYDRKTLTQSRNEEKTLIDGTHPLSKYFTFTGFITHDDREAVVARCSVTIYDEDETAYIGFFECINDDDCAKATFNAVFEFLKEKKLKRIVGPVNASFWIGYRLKDDHFNSEIYTAEPYNKDYYKDLFTKNGFSVSQRYTSNFLKVPHDNYDIYKKRFDQFTQNGYVIKSPGKNDFDFTLSEIYSLLIDLYSDFPVFKYIKEDDFTAVFSPLKNVLNFKMVKIAYKDGKAVGFFICFPNYKNLLHKKMNILNILKVLAKKTFSKEYILLYMGVSADHLGLGAALNHSLIVELRKRKSLSITALMLDGKITQSYGKDLIYDTYNYILLTKELAKQNSWTMQNNSI